jgi:hypothetical protein
VSWGGAALTFASIFLAGVVAFYLDSLRERRARERWVHEYLGFWRRQLESIEGERERNQALFDRIDDTLGAWADGEEPADWDDVEVLNFTTPLSLTPILFGEGMSVVPPDLLTAMFELDTTLPGLSILSESAVRLFETEIRPMQMARRCPLAETERRFVERYRGKLRDTWRGYAALYDQLDGLLALMRAKGI